MKHILEITKLCDNYIDYLLIHKLYYQTIIGTILRVFIYFQMATHYIELDMDNIINNWASKMFEYTNDTDLNSGDFVFVLDYSKVRFSDLEPIYYGLDQGIPRSEVLHEAILWNETDIAQSMSLRTTKSSTLIAKFDLTSVIVADGKTKLKVTHLPQVTTSKFPTELNMEMVGCQKEFIEKLEWQIDNPVNVERRSKVKASIVVDEKSYEGRFSVKTEISGNIKVNIVNPDENNRLYKSIQGNIAEILKKYNKDGNKIQGLTFNKNNAAVFVSEGVCKFRFGINCNVNLQTLE